MAPSQIPSLRAGVSESLPRGMKKSKDALALPVEPPTAIAALPPELIEAAVEMGKSAKAAATWRAYGADWDDWTRWAKATRQRALPASPNALAAYLVSRARSGLRASTLRRRLTGIGLAHRAAGFDPPPTSNVKVLAVMSGIARTERPVAKEYQQPLRLAQLRAILGTFSQHISARRNHALLLLGWAAALRRSEIVGLDRGDLDFQPGGVFVRVRAIGVAGGGRRIGTKADPRGEAIIDVPAGRHRETDVSLQLRLWLAAAKIESGPVFRGLTKYDTVREGRLSDRTVDKIVKRAVAEALPDVDSRSYGAHSLRAGFITEARDRGIPDAKIMLTSRHKRQRMLDEYDRRTAKFGRGATGDVGL